MVAPRTPPGAAPASWSSSSPEAEPAADRFHEDKTHGHVQFPIAHYTNSARFGEPLRSDIAPHWHEEAEFVFVRQGKANLTVAGGSFAMDAETVLFVQPAVLHSLVPVSKDLVWHCLVFDLDFALGPIIGSSHQKYLPVLNSQVPPDSLVLPASRNGLRPDWFRSVETIIQELRTQPFGYEVRVRAAILDLLGRFLRLEGFQSELKPNKSLKVRRLEPCLRFIRENYQDHLTVDQIAAAGHMSKYYLCHLFKEVADISPIEYLNYYRVHRATGLLDATTKTITEVAMDVGYTDPSYFSRVFKSFIRLSPSEYRAR